MREAALKLLDREMAAILESQGIDCRVIRTAAVPDMIAPHPKKYRKWLISFQGNSSSGPWSRLELVRPPCGRSISYPPSTIGLLCTEVIGPKV